jgi:hypothetical protein
LSRATDAYARVRENAAADEIDHDDARGVRGLTLMASDIIKAFRTSDSQKNRGAGAAHADPD